MIRELLEIVKERDRRICGDRSDYYTHTSIFNIEIVLDSMEIIMPKNFVHTF
jgi:hypothetical protein